MPGFPAALCPGCSCRTLCEKFITKHLVRKSCRDLGTTSSRRPPGRLMPSCVKPMTTSAIPEDVARRRSRRDARVRAYNDLQERRARLAAGTSIKPEFEYELLTMFVRNELGAAVTMPALYALFAIACMFWAPTVEAVVWLIIVIGAKVVLLDQGAALPDAPAGAGEHPGSGGGASCSLELFNGLRACRLRAHRRRATRCGAPNELIFSSHVFIFATLIVVLAIRTMFAATHSGHPLRRHRADDDRRRGAPAACSTTRSTSPSRPWRWASTSTSCSSPAACDRRHCRCSSTAPRRTR